MIQFRILGELRLVLFCNRGKTSVEEIYKVKKEFRASFEGLDGYDAILDVSNSDDQYTEEQIQKLALPSSIDLFSGRKLAIVASSDLAFGMSRMYEMTMLYDRSYEISVFRDTGSALAWLGREGIEAELERVFSEMLAEEA